MAHVIQEVPEGSSIDKLMGLAVFGEMTAARAYHRMAQLRPEHADTLMEFARMEGAHGRWFREASLRNGITPDRQFADGELSYLIEQIDDHFAARDFDALAVIQGFIVESLAVAVYRPFLDIADKYPGTHDAFEVALREEEIHIDWIRSYFREEFDGRLDIFVDLTNRVNVHGIACVGGSMMNIASLLDDIGISGADCAGAMMDSYSELLEAVGLERKDATKSVVSLFVPLMRKFRIEQSVAS